MLPRFLFPRATPILRVGSTLALALLLATPSHAEKTVGAETRFTKAGEPMLDIGNVTIVKQYIVDWKEGGGGYWSQDVGFGPFTSTFWADVGGGTSGVFGVELGLCVGGSADFDLGFQPILTLPDKLVSGIPLPLTVESPIQDNSSFQTRFPGLGNAYADLIFDARGKIDATIHIPAIPNIGLAPAINTRDVKLGELELSPSLRCDPALFSPIATSLPWPGWRTQDQVPWGIEAPSVFNPNPRYYGLELVSINRDNTNKLRHLNIGPELLTTPFKEYDAKIDENFAGGLGRILIKNPIILTDSQTKPWQNNSTMLRSEGEDDVFGIFIDIAQLIATGFKLPFPLADDGSYGSVDWEYIIASLDIGPVIKLGLDYEVTWTVEVSNIAFDRDVRIGGSIGRSFSDVGITGRQLTNCGISQLPSVELLDETLVNATLSYNLVANLRTLVSAPIVARVDYQFLGAHVELPHIGRTGIPSDADALIEDQHNFEMARPKVYTSNRRVVLPNTGFMFFTMQSSGPATFEWTPSAGTGGEDWATASSWLETNTGLPAGVPDHTSDVTIPASTAKSPIVHGGQSASTLSLGANSTFYISSLANAPASLLIYDAFLENNGNIHLTGAASMLNLPGEIATLCGNGTITLYGSSLQGSSTQPDSTIVNYNNITGSGSAFNQLAINAGTSKINNIGSITANLTSPPAPLKTSATTYLNQEQLSAINGGDLQLTTSFLQTGIGSSIVATSYPSQINISILDTARHTGLMRAHNGGTISISSPTPGTVFNAAQAINENAGQFYSLGNGSLLDLEGMLMIGGCFMADLSGNISATNASFQDTVIRIGSYQEGGAQSYETLTANGTSEITNSDVINYGKITVPGSLSVLSGKSFINHGSVIVPTGGSLDIERFSLDLVKEDDVVETVYRPGVVNALPDVLIGGSWDIAGTLDIEQAAFRKLGAAPAKTYSGSTYIDINGQSRQAVVADDNAEELSYGKSASVTLRGPNWDFPAIETLELNQGSFLLVEGATFDTVTDFANLGFNYVSDSTLTINGVYTQMGNDASTYVIGNASLIVPSNEYNIIGGSVKSDFANQIFGRTGSDAGLDNIKLNIQGLPDSGSSNPNPDPALIDLSLDGQPGFPETYAKITTLGPDAEVSLHGFVEFDALYYLADIQGKLTYSGDGLSNHGEFALGDPVLNGELNVFGSSTELEVNSFTQQSGRTTIGSGAVLSSYDDINITGGEIVFEIGERRPGRGEPHIGAQETNGLLSTGGAIVTLGDSIVVKFLPDVNPQIGDTWPIVRGSVTPERITANFEAARFEGATPPAGAKFVLSREGYYLFAKVVIDGPSVSYDDWIETNAIPESMAGLDQDADGNGVSNAIDFAFGGSTLAEHSFLDIDGQTLVEISFTRPSGTTRNVAYNVFVRSTDVDDPDWVFRSDFQQVSVVPFDGSDLELVTLRELAPNSVETDQFRVEALILDLPIRSESGFSPERPAGNVGYAGTERGKLGKIIYAQVREKTNGRAVGTDRYRDNSEYDTAATHAGLIAQKPSNSSSMVVKVTILERLDSYVSTTRNGVTSQSYDGPFEEGEVSFTMELLNFDDYAFYQSAVIPSLRDPDNLPEMLTITELDNLPGDTATLSLTWESEADAVYELERSTDLVQWETLDGEYPSGGATTTTEIEVDTSASTLFYRVKIKAEPAL